MIGIRIKPRFKNNEDQVSIQRCWSDWGALRDMRMIQLLGKLRTQCLLHAHQCPLRVFLSLHSRNCFVQTAPARAFTLTLREQDLIGPVLAQEGRGGKVGNCVSVCGLLHVGKDSQLMSILGGKASRSPATSAASRPQAPRESTLLPMRVPHSPHQWWFGRPSALRWLKMEPSPLVIFT